jgi:RNA polymerase sigma-70 factor (ECF subfamily)
LFDKVLSKYRFQSDSDITSALKKGNQKAYKVLFDRYHKKVYNVSRRMNISHEDAEGVVQDVFLTIWEKRIHLDKDLSINAFLMTIAKRLIYKKFRSEVVKRRHIQGTQETADNWQNNTEDYIIFTDLAQDAQKGIDKLPENRKHIFMLSKENGLSNDQIAEQLNISKRTVENQLYRATKTIKEHINKSK